MRSLLLFLIRSYQTLRPASMRGPAGTFRRVPSTRTKPFSGTALSGGWLAIKRVARCHPLGSHGLDPVP